jgi:L-fucose isomerase-like protein
MQVRLGFIPSHRHPFDENWAIEMRRRSIEALGKLDQVDLVYPGVGLVPDGLICDDAGAEAAIDLFARRGVQGIIIGAMTFGDEVSAVRVAEALDLPVLVFATKEGPFTPEGGRRSDAFCGALSITSGLYRRKLPYRFAGVVWPEDPSLAREVEGFGRACAAVETFYGARVGLIGSRPERFETCVFNESAMIAGYRQRVVHLSLHDLFARAEELAADDPLVRATLAEIQTEADCSACSQDALVKAARLELALRRYASESNLSAMAMACWEDVQRHYGICACSTLGRLTGRGVPTSCEADVYGALTMLIQHRVALEETVPHFIDWTIRHQEQEDMLLAWHCGNAPACLARTGSLPVMREQAIMSEVVGAERAQGAIEMQLREGPVTLCRLVEYDGEFKMLVTAGEIVPSEDELRGSWSWVRVADLAGLYATLAEEGFVHHASMIHGDLVDAVEGFCHYCGIRVVRV